MAAADKSVRTYQELASCYEQIGEPQVRDRFLVLAAEAALNAGNVEQAESIRGRLLQLNPHHLLKPYASLSQAMQSPDVKTYVDGLRRTYPRENAEQMLESIRSGAAAKKPVAADGSPTFPPFQQMDAGRAESARPKRETPSARPVSAPRAEATPVPPPASPPVLQPPAAPPPAPAKAEAPIPFAPDFSTPPAAPASDRSPTSREGTRSRGEINLLATLLFLLTLFSGLALAIYTFVKPFLAPSQ